MARLRILGIRVFVSLVFLGLASGCSIQLVSDYDEQIDNGLSQLNTDVAVFVTRMINVAANVKIKKKRSLSRFMRFRINVPAVCD